MAEYIEREAVMQKFADHVKRSNNSDFAPVPTWNQAVQIVEDFPAADVRPVVKAKWEDVHIDRPEIADIEVATMFCPHCNRWHNEVYHYGNPIEFANYCSFCGASMREES